MSWRNEDCEVVSITESVIGNTDVKQEVIKLRSKDIGNFFLSDETRKIGQSKFFFKKAWLVENPVYMVTIFKISFHSIGSEEKPRNASYKFISRATFMNISFHNL